MITKLLITCLGGAFLVLTTNVVSASVIGLVTIDDAVRDAQLIFKGTVTKIESRIADTPKIGYVGEYYAFVTYTVNNIYKGSIDGNSETITLRIESCLVGYPQEQPNVTVKTGESTRCGITGIPHFTVGDSDFLFVGGNEHDICPLVGWGQGRFHIINNKISPSAWLNEEGLIDFTPPYKDAQQLSTDDFTKILKQKLQDSQINLKNKKSSSIPVKSANIKNPLYYYDPLSIPKNQRQNRK